MTPSIAALLYLVSGVLFILALRGLSSPETSRQGNTYGMVGMAISVVTTLLAVKLDVTTIGLILAATAIGGGVGAVLARKIAMTSMPQLVAAFHSLVGLAAVLIAGAAMYSPEAFHIAADGGGIKTASLIEMGLGIAIGSITFTGSLIAFAKLNGNMSGAPIILPARHLLNILILVGIIALIGVLTREGDTNPHGLMFKGASIRGIFVGSKGMAQRLNAFIDAHGIKPVVDKAFAMEAAKDAYAYQSSAGLFGKVVITL